MSEAKKLIGSLPDQASTEQSLLTVEAQAESSSTALPRLVLLLRKHQVEITHLECTKNSSGFQIIFSSDSPPQKIVRVANEARRLEEFQSVEIHNPSRG